MHRHITHAALGALLALSAGVAAAQPLTIGLVTGPSSADPHFHAVTTNSQFRRHIHEGLTGADANNRPHLNSL